MEKVIIGIHGLANKPEKATLKDWWRTSINEGLAKNCGFQDQNFDFELVYWANYLYKYRMHEEEAFNFDKLYNDQPYTAAEQKDLKDYKETWVDYVREKTFNLAGETIDTLKKNFGMDALADRVLAGLLKDLAFYYDENRKLKNRNGEMERAADVLKNELKEALRNNRNKEIMLISHSMGSIVAYDALRELGQSDRGLEVAHFITIGSPLGLPHVKHKIMEQCKHDRTVRTPSIVTKSWINFADRKDPVALDIHLRDDYDKNDAGVRVEDDLVFNNYKNPKGEGNAHKSYGYLRTPELSRHVAAFLGALEQSISAS